MCRQDPDTVDKTLETPAGPTFPLRWGRVHASTQASPSLSGNQTARHKLASTPTASAGLPKNLPEILPTTRHDQTLQSRMCDLRLSPHTTAHTKPKPVLNASRCATHPNLAMPAGMPWA